LCGEQGELAPKTRNRPHGSETAALRRDLAERIDHIVDRRIDQRFVVTLACFNPMRPSNLVGSAPAIIAARNRGRSLNFPPCFDGAEISPGLKPPMER
jgi:hypothetical protein